MSSSKNLRAIQKPQPLQGFYYFQIKYYLLVLLRMQGLYKRLKKLKASKDLT